MEKYIDKIKMIVNKKSYILLFILLLNLQGCEKEYANIAINCGTDAQSTGEYAYKLAFGIDTFPILGSEIHPVSISSLKSLIEKRESDALHLVFSGKNGTMFSIKCSKLLCTEREFFRIFDQCKNNYECRMAGVVKYSNFYPMYLHDRNKNHICNGRWSLVNE